MSKQKITLRDSGYSYEVETEEFMAELAQHGDDPREYSTDLADFDFFSEEPEDTEDWPDHLPSWSYRPA